MSVFPIMVVCGGHCYIVHRDGGLAVVVATVFSVVGSGRCYSFIVMAVWWWLLQNIIGGR